MQIRKQNHWFQPHEEKHNRLHDNLYLFTTVPHPHGHWQLQELLGNNVAVNEVRHTATQELTDRQSYCFSGYVVQSLRIPFILATSTNLF